MTSSGMGAPTAGLWPAANTLVLRSRPLRLSTDSLPISRFTDEVWHLGPAQLNDHDCPLSENWALFPAELREAFKVCAFAALDGKWPAALQPPLVDEQPEVITVHKWIMHWRVFAPWLAARKITRLCDIGDGDLGAYKAYVLGLPLAQQKHAHLLHAVRVLWGYRDRLPEECRLPASRPWGKRTADQLAGIRGRDSPYNKIPRIDPATMEALLAWALRMVEDFGPDIREAFFEQRVLLDGEHPITIAARSVRRRPVVDRLGDYLSALREADRGVPGLLRPNGQLQPDYAHIGRMIGRARQDVQEQHDQLMAMAAGFGLILESDAYFLDTVTARLHGAPWRDRPFGVREINRLVRLLAAACFVVICYLSGMRSGEVLKLRRRCLQLDELGQHVIVGRRSKGADHAPTPDPADETERPWAVVDTVTAAVEMLESLSDGELLFPPSRQRRTARSRREQSKPSGMMNVDIREFIDWVNDCFGRADGSPAIPPDPSKAIHAGRFRRTLAYFVVRQPGGLAAAQLQYGHVKAKVTLSYAGDADTGWLEDLALEELEMLVEQTGEDLQALQDGEHVSGSSADEYRRRVGTGASFAGRVVNQVRNARRLMASADPHVHHGLGMTCVWRYETAGCRDEREAAGLPVSAPDDRLCRSDCTNLAYTDRDIQQKRSELARWEADAADPLSPEPLRQRARMQADQLREVIENHERTRPGTGGPGQRAR